MRGGVGGDGGGSCGPKEEKKGVEGWRGGGVGGGTGTAKGMCKLLLQCPLKLA